MHTPVFTPGRILLPAENVDIGLWATLACDQHTSNPDYWRRVESLVGGLPSTLRIILPEVYLEEDGASRVGPIHTAMRHYRSSVLLRAVEGYVYVERQTHAGVRQGLVGCVDLNAYDYRRGAAPRIRPSERTVEERIPPRLAVRRDACIESPHVLMLIDDDAGAVVEPLAAERDKMPLLYDQQLMLGGGRVRGWAVTDPGRLARIEAALLALEDAGRYRARYGAGEGDAPFAFAVGDGNHSLATAKAAWEEIKPSLSAAEAESHPARRCLVELENIQCPAITIEPIHRVAFGPSGEEVLRAFRDYARLHGTELCENGEDAGPGGQRLALVYGGREVALALPRPKEPMAAGTADAALAVCAGEHPGLRVDYVHGEQAVRELAEGGAVGLLLPVFEKQELFRGVALGGVLPKKTFSMGHAEEKRYYLECRAITEDF